jgi:hypothetical protein
MPVQSRSIVLEVVGNSNLKVIAPVSDYGLRYVSISSVEYWGGYILVLGIGR